MKWLYLHCRWFYMLLIGVRMDFYFFTNQREKAKQIITEELKWMKELRRSLQNK